jgi:hypothetical protein
MKALTLTQPWATLMATREKTIETRSWWTGFRGEMVIHAAKGFPKWAKETCDEYPFKEALRGLSAADLPLSRGLCVVRVLGCIRTDEMHKAEAVLGRKPAALELHFGDYSEGRFAWLTEYVRPLNHDAAVRGALGLWNWPEDGPSLFGGE